MKIISQETTPRVCYVYGFREGTCEDWGDEAMRVFYSDGRANCLLAGVAGMIMDTLRQLAQGNYQLVIGEDPAGGDFPLCREKRELVEEIWRTARGPSI